MRFLIPSAQETCTDNHKEWLQFSPAVNVDNKEFVDVMLGEVKYFADDTWSKNVLHLAHRSAIVVTSRLVEYSSLNGFASDLPGLNNLIPSIT